MLFHTYVDLFNPIDLFCRPSNLTSPPNPLQWLEDSKLVYCRHQCMSFSPRTIRYYIFIILCFTILCLSTSKPYPVRRFVFIPFCLGFIIPRRIQDSRSWLTFIGFCLLLLTEALLALFPTGLFGLKYHVIVCNFYLQIMRQP